MPVRAPELGRTTRIEPFFFIFVFGAPRMLFSFHVILFFALRYIVLVHTLPLALRSSHREQHGEDSPHSRTGRTAVRTRPWRRRRAPEEDNQ